MTSNPITPGLWVVREASGPNRGEPTVADVCGDYAYIVSWEEKMRLGKAARLFEFAGPLDLEAYVRWREEKPQ